MPAPHHRHTTAAGDAEPIPDALRDRLLAGRGGSAETPETPRRHHRTGRPAPSVIDRPLSTRQKAVLCQMARTAYEVMRSHGLVDEGQGFAEWRHAEQLAAVGVASLRECRQPHYRALRGHFSTLVGRMGAEQLADLTAPADDTDRQIAAHALRAEVERRAERTGRDGRRTGWHQAEGYLLEIARDQARGPEPVSFNDIAETWPPTRIWSLVYTMRKRLRKK